MTIRIFNPTIQDGNWWLVGEVTTSSGNLLIVDPCYLRDGTPAFERAATTALAEIGDSGLGDDFCVPPGDSFAVAVRLPNSVSRLPVHALLANKYPSGLPIGGLWIPFDQRQRPVVIDLDDDHWRELGAFSVDAGQVVLFDGKLAATDWELVNKRIDEVTSQERHWYERLEWVETDDGIDDRWPSDEAERAEIRRGILGTRAFELTIENQAAALSSTGNGDGRYYVYAYLPPDEELTNQPAGIWIDFEIEGDDPIPQSLSDEQRDILARMRAYLSEPADNIPADLRGLGAGVLFQRIAHLLWLGRLKQLPLPLPQSLVDATLSAAAREEYLASRALSNPMIGEERAAALARSAHGWERACAARNPQTTPADLGRLADDRHSGIVILLAENPAAPAEALRMLAAKPDHDIRAAVASNPATPADAVAILARDRKYQVRMAVAQREDLSPELLREMLDNDSSPYIRAELLRRHDLPKEEATEAILGLARVLHTDEIGHFTDLLERIEPGDLAPSDADAPALRFLAESRGPMTEDDFLHIEQQGDIERRAAIALHPDCPVDILARMAAGDDRRLWRLVATNPSTPAESLARLVEAGDTHTSFGALGNLSLPRDALMKLLRSDNSWLADTAAAHPDLTFDEVLVCLRDAGRPIPEELLSRPDCPPEFIGELGGSADPAERLLVAECDSTPPELLAALATDPDPEIRKAVAENRETPVETLAAMLHDTDSDVVMSAAKSRRLDPGLVVSICEAPESALTTSQCIELLSMGIPMSAGRIRALASDAKSWELSTIARSPAAPADLLELLALAVRVDDEGEEEGLSIVGGEGAARLEGRLSNLIAAATMM